MNYYEQAKRGVGIWLVVSWICLISAAVCVLLVMFVTWTNWGWGVIAAFCAIMLFLASLRAADESDWWGKIMWGWQMLEAGGGTEEMKDLYKTLQFQTGMLQHNEEEQNFVRTEIERTKREMEENF